MPDGAAGADVLGPLAALLTSLGGIIGVLWRMTTATNTRVDHVTAGQIQTLTDERDRSRQERDQERNERIAAQKEADRWSEKHQEMAVRAARAEVEAASMRHLLQLPPEAGTASSGGVTPSP